MYLEDVNRYICRMQGLGKRARVEGRAASWSDKALFKSGYER